MVVAVDQLETTTDSLSPARRNVLIALKEQGEACADDLAASLGISPSAVRQHLAGLRTAGYVSTRPSRGRPGRPVDLYHSTSRGDEVFRPHDSTLTLELLRDVEAEDPELVDRIFERRERRRAAEYRSKLAGLDFEERLSGLCELLDAEGYLTRWSKLDDGAYLVTFNNCAIWKIAQHYRLACTTELDFLRDVLGEVTVERIVHRRDGNYSCGYQVSPLPA